MRCGATVLRARCTPGRPAHWRSSVDGCQQLSTAPIGVGACRPGRRPGCGDPRARRACAAPETGRLSADRAGGSRYGDRRARRACAAAETARLIENSTIGAVFEYECTICPVFVMGVDGLPTGSVAEVSKLESGSARPPGLGKPDPRVSASSTTGVSTDLADGRGITLGTGDCGNVDAAYNGLWRAAASRDHS